MNKSMTSRGDPVVSIISLTSLAFNFELADKTNAHTPATKGQEADVPSKCLYNPPVPLPFPSCQNLKLSESP